MCYICKYLESKNDLNALNVKKGDTTNKCLLCNNDLCDVHSINVIQVYDRDFVVCNKCYYEAKSKDKSLIFDLYVSEPVFKGND